MPRGAPDFHNIYSLGQITRMLDMGELAARLWSPNVFERAGDLLWMDDFRYGLAAWNTDNSGTGASTSIVPSPGAFGGYSAKLVAGTTDQVRARINRNLPYPVLGKYGFEVAFTVDSNLESFGIYVELMDGSVRHRARGRYDHVNSRLRYITGLGVYGDLATGISLSETTKLFHIMKLVVDFETGQYIRLLLDETEYSMAGLTVAPIADDSDPFLRLMVNIYATDGTSPITYIDNAIITRNEL